MGPDEQTTSKNGMVITPINKDGSYGEPIKYGEIKAVHEKDLQDLDLTEKNELIFNAALTGEFNVKFRHKKISKKTFKKWLMSNNFDRDLAERFCQIIGSFGGRIDYQNIYTQSFLVPTPNLVLNSIVNEGERTHG